MGSSWPFRRFESMDVETSGLRVTLVDRGQLNSIGPVAALCGFSPARRWLLHLLVTYMVVTSHFFLSFAFAGYDHLCPQRMEAEHAKLPEEGREELLQRPSR